MSIALKATGYCEKCPHIDLVMNEFSYADGIWRYSVSCLHEPTCYHIQAEHEKAMREIDDVLEELCEVDHDD